MSNEGEAKEIEKEVIVTNVRSEDDIVILDIRFTKPIGKEPTEQRLLDRIEPIPKSQAEMMGRDVAKGYLSAVQDQIQRQMQSLTQIVPPPLPKDMIRITLSKQEYVKIGRPTVFDKLTLKLQIKAVQTKLN